VAQACGQDDPTLAMAAAISLEFLHCAWLAHDDLPCFDDADTRARTTFSVHRAFGESLAVLTGDALIVLAFQTLARGSQKSPLRLAPCLTPLAAVLACRSASSRVRPGNANQGYRCPTYQRAKTGALFVAATAAGALAAGADPGPWRALGEWLRRGHQWPTIYGCHGRP